MKSVITIFLFCFCFIFSSAQNQLITVKGKIENANGDPILAETVRVKHMQGGICSSNNGEFQLDGVKPGDTLVFSGVSYQGAYFVVDRRYNYLLCKLKRDTLQTNFRDYDKSTAFSCEGRVANYLHNNRIEFYETPDTVIQVPNSKINKERIFVKVEVEPYFYSAYPKFLDSLANDINKLKIKRRPKKPGQALVYFWIRFDKKIEVSSVTTDLNDEIKRIFTERFQSFNSVVPAIQNGRYTNTLCVAAFQLDIGEDKTITVKMQNF